MGGGVLRHSPCSQGQAGPRHRFAAPPSDWGGPQGGGGGGGVMGGRVGLGGRRPDPGLLVPDASRQEAEANMSTRPRLLLTSRKLA